MNDLRIVKGKVASPEAPVVFAIMKNEMFFLPAFLSHYRSLGVRQFLILDDRSNDGTTEFLAAQPDCAVVESSYSFSDIVDGEKIYQLWKNWIPERFLKDQWAICVDADEFLLLPPEFDTIDGFTGHMEEMGATAAGALMIDFYPETVAQLDHKWRPENLRELVDEYPYFDRGPYISWKAGSLRPQIIYGGVRERLLRQYNINKRNVFSFAPKDVWRFAKNLLKKPKPIGSMHKVPIVKWISGRCYLNSHTLNFAPDGGIVLPIIHFKFTSAFKEKLDVAVNQTKAPERAFAYNSYDAMLEKMRQAEASFVSDDSLKFLSPADLFQLARVEG